MMDGSAKVSPVFPKHITFTGNGVPSGHLSDRKLAHFSMWPGLSPIATTSFDILGMKFVGFLNPPLSTHGASDAPSLS
jgi:hypothetical protein